MSRPKDSSSPFAVLGALRDALPPGPTVERMATPVLPKPPARAVVRFERKGRKGKEATVIEKLGLSAGDLEVWCRELKQGLGCGGSVEGETIMLQGDLRQRLPAMLTARGVAKVTVA